MEDDEIAKRRERWRNAKRKLKQRLQSAQSGNVADVNVDKGIRQCSTRSSQVTDEKRVQQKERWRNAKHNPKLKLQSSQSGNVVDACVDKGIQHGSARSSQVTDEEREQQRERWRNAKRNLKKKLQSAQLGNVVDACVDKGIRHGSARSSQVTDEEIEQQRERWRNAKRSLKKKLQSAQSGNVVDACVDKGIQHGSARSSQVTDEEIVQQRERWRNAKRNKKKRLLSAQSSNVVDEDIQHESTRSSQVTYEERVQQREQWRNAKHNKKRKLFNAGSGSVIGDTISRSDTLDNQFEAYERIANKTAQTIRGNTSKILAPGRREQPPYGITIEGEHCCATTNRHGSETVYVRKRYHTRSYCMERSSQMIDDGIARMGERCRIAERKKRRKLQNSGGGVVIDANMDTVPVPNMFKEQSHMRESIDKFLARDDELNKLGKTGDGLRSHKHNDTMKTKQGSQIDDERVTRRRERQRSYYRERSSQLTKEEKDRKRQEWRDYKRMQKRNLQAVQVDKAQSCTAEPIDIPGMCIKQSKNAAGPHREVKEVLRNECLDNEDSCVIMDAAVTHGDVDENSRAENVGNGDRSAIMGDPRKESMMDTVKTNGLNTCIDRTAEFQSEEGMQRLMNLNEDLQAGMEPHNIGTVMDNLENSISMSIMIPHESIGCFTHGIDDYEGKIGQSVNALGQIGELERSEVGEPFVGTPI